MQRYILSIHCMQIRLLSSLLLVLAVVGTSPSHAAEKKSYTFGLIGNTSNQFFEAARSGANARPRANWALSMA